MSRITVTISMLDPGHDRALANGGFAAT